MFVTIVPTERQIDCLNEEDNMVTKAIKRAGAPKQIRAYRGSNKQHSRVFPQRDPTKTEGVEDGQKGVPLDLPVEYMNPNELAVLRCFGLRDGYRTTLSITEIADKAFPKKSEKRANSWVRNSLRRLVRGSWLESIDRGVFRFTQMAVTKLQHGDQAKTLRVA